MVKTHFRLYDSTNKSYDASIFDFISGKNEPKQTKGLAYIFSQYNDFLFDFLNYDVVKSKICSQIKDFNTKDIDTIEVSAEKITVCGDRADIVIKLSRKNIPLIALIIEAKSIKVKTNQKDLSDQIKEKYLKEGSFADLGSIKKLGIV
jgi:hypothetical protein